MFAAEHMVNNIWKTMGYTLACDILACEFEFEYLNYHLRLRTMTCDFGLFFWFQPEAMTDGSDFAPVLYCLKNSIKKIPRRFKYFGHNSTRHFGLCFNI